MSDCADLGQLDYFRGLAAQLASAPHGARGQMIDDATAFLGISRAQAYAKLRRAGWRSGRKLRTDKGDSRLSDEDAQTIGNLLTESTRGNGKRLLSVGDAMEIALANGLIANTGISPASALRIMRARGFHPEQLARATPHTPMQSLHPNHVWQFDVSVCVLFYLDDGGAGVMDEKWFYKNKPANLKKISTQRVLRYLVTDHYSGTLYVEYFLAQGEDQQTLFNFLMSAFAKREHAQDPFHGVPFILMWDAGSANQSFLIRNLLDRLTVEHRAHLPGNPRGKGQVENAHNIVERKFEGRLKFVRIRDVDHLNAEAHVWMREFNGGRIHSRHDHTRYGLWQKIRAEQLRIAPPRALCEQLLTTKPEPRTVSGSLMISYRVKGQETADYSLRHCEEVRVGETVEVCVNPYRAPNVDVIVKRADGTQKIYECAPIARNEAGFWADAPVIGRDYQAAPDTLTDRHRKHMAKQAFGVETQLEVDAKRKNRTPAFEGIDPVSYLKDQTHAHYMARRGQHLPVEVPRNEPALITPTQALIRLARTLGRPLSPEEHESFTHAYPQGLTDEDLQAWLTQRPDAQQATG